MKKGRRKEGRWLISPIAPVIVALIGFATAATIALLTLKQLQQMSDEAASQRSKALAQALAARMRALPSPDRSTVLGRAARRSGAEILLVEQSGTIVVNHSLMELDAPQVQSLLARGPSMVETQIGRTGFAAYSLDPPLEHLSVMAFVDAPLPALGSIALSNAVAVLTFLLVGMAVSVAFLFMRAARDDVTYVRQRIADMAQEHSPALESAVAEQASESVPIRSLDQVGLLTASLNVLISRFAAAERGYRADVQQAAQLDNERSQFLAGLSHELRTPLNAILGFTHLLESEDDGPLSDEAKEALATISASGEHLKSLIADILDLSAMETGQVRLSRTVVDVYELAEQVVAEARGTIEDPDSVQLRLGGERHAYAWADARRLRQVLTNLVSNALKFTVTGQVRVAVGTGASQVTVAVSDSGEGIAQEALATIFEAYEQAGDARSRRRGAGLGLAIARRLVLLHGGTITVASELHRGSTFTITIPDESHTATLPRDSIVPAWDQAEIPAREGEAKRR